MLAVPIGVLNAFVNLVVWVVNAGCVSASESIYRRVSSYKLLTTGRTHNTDANEVQVHAWLFGYLWRHRCTPLSWTWVLLLSNLALLPLELLLEAGVDEKRSCAPLTLNSKGVCAAPWRGHSPYSIAAAALSVQRHDWVDSDWQFVAEGANKIPRAAEVHVHARELHVPKRRYVIRGCKVRVRGCPAAGCGKLSILRAEGAFATVATDWTHAPRNVPLTGDVTYDKSTSVAYLFWRGRRRRDAARTATNSSIIEAHGVETLLSEQEVRELLHGKREKWALTLNATRTRTYRIQCGSDGVPARDLALATSLYRTTQMEQPGVRRSEVRGNLTRLPPLTASDVVKAAYAMKASDWSDDCAGRVDAYRQCGGFGFALIAPFFALAGAILLAWVAVLGATRRVTLQAPTSAASWRALAMTGIGSGLGRAARDDDDAVLTLEALEAGVRWKSAARSPPET